MANILYRTINANQFQYDAALSRFSIDFSDVTVVTATANKFKYTYMYQGAKITVIEKGDFVYNGSIFAMVALKSQVIKIKEGGVTTTIGTSTVDTKIPVSNIPDVKWNVDTGGSTFSDYNGSGNKGDFVSLSGVADYFNSNGGNDKVYGLGGNDQLWGGAGKDKLWGGSGKDQLWGGSSKDQLWGGAGNDKLWGGAGNDKLWGGAGNDKLWGDTGNDKLWGGAGKDRFYFGDNDDKDVINDFQNNKDTIVLDNNLWTGTKSVNKVLNQFGTQNGNDYVLDFGSGDILTIKNATKNQLLDDITIA